MLCSRECVSSFDPMICRKRHFLFVHVPRTGGQSIERSLFPAYDFQHSSNFDILYGWEPQLGWLNHLTYRQIVAFEEERGTDLSRFFSFAFVRNPWERLVSEYCWKMGWGKTSFTRYVEMLHEEPELVAKVFKGPQAFLQHALPQADYICDHEDRPLVDFVGRFENKVILEPGG